MSWNLPCRFGRVVSALKIPFPGNGDFGSKRRGPNAGSSDETPLGIEEGVGADQKRLDMAFGERGKRWLDLLRGAWPCELHAPIEGARGFADLS
jgi:hypothetical protein